MTRRNNKTLRILIAVFSASTLSATNATACFTPAPFVFEDIKMADIIFEGTVLKYDYIGCPKEPLLAECHSLIDIAVHRTLRGEDRKQWTLYWGNSIYGVPERWEGEKRRIFAGRWADSDELPVRSGSATTVPSARPEFLQVLQAPCSDPFFLPANEETVEKIRALIDAKSEENENENDQSR